MSRYYKSEKVKIKSTGRDIELLFKKVSKQAAQKFEEKHLYACEH